MKPTQRYGQWTGLRSVKFFIINFIINCYKREEGYYIKNNKRQRLIVNKTDEEEQNPTAHIIGKLTVNFEREDGSIYSVSKSAPGSQPIVGGQETQENAFKSANSDALKKAATMFGIALELYRKGKEQEYFNAINYENPWTNEEKEKHKDNFNYINSFMQKYNVAFEGINQMVGICFNGYFNNLNAITPEYLNQFVNYLKNVEEKSKKPSNILDE